MQFARPRSDVTNVGWQSFGSTITSDRWTLLAEPVPNDAIGIRTGNNPAGSEFEAGLTIIGAPADASDLTLRYRYEKSAADGRQIDLQVRVLQGTTQLATVTHVDVVGGAVTESTLAVPVASITDYADLRAEFVATAVGAGTNRHIRIYNCRLEAANDVAPAAITELRALTPWALHRFREGAGAVANDEVANAHMAAASGESGGFVSRPTFAQATMLPDGSDTSAAFDGVDDEIESAGFTSYTGNGTIVLLLRAGATASRASNETIFRCQSAGAAGLVALQWGAAGQYVLHYRNDAGSGFFQDLWTPAEDDVDLIFIVTDGTDLRVYRDGSTTAEFTTAAQTAQTHDELGVGANKTSDAFAEFDVQILAVYRSALTETNRLDVHDAVAGAAGETVTANQLLEAAVQAATTASSNDVAIAQAAQAATQDAAATAAADASAAQLAEAATQAADLSASAAVDVSQALPDASQSTTVNASADVAAAQTLEEATQDASVGSAADVTATQLTEPATQAAAISAGDALTVSATQATLPAVQAATVDVAEILTVAAAQTLEEAAQAATLEPLLTADAAQTLEAALQAATVHTGETVTAAQATDPATQAAAATALLEASAAQTSEPARTDASITAGATVQATQNLPAATQAAEISEPPLFILGPPIRYTGISVPAGRAIDTAPDDLAIYDQGKARSIAR